MLCKETSSADCYCLLCHCWNRVLGDTCFFSLSHLSSVMGGCGVDFFAINEIHSWPCSVLQFFAAVASLAFRTADPSSTPSVLCWASEHGTWRLRGDWNRARSFVTLQDPRLASLGAREEGWRDKFKLSHGARHFLLAWQGRMVLAMALMDSALP